VNDMTMARLGLRVAPAWRLAWLDRRSGPFAELPENPAWHEGIRRWHRGRAVNDQANPF
jgi:hypothetical protein